MWRLPIFILAILLCNINNSSAQFAADKDAAYLATIKAVADFMRWCRNFLMHAIKMQKISESSKF